VDIFQAAVDELGLQPVISQGVVRELKRISEGGKPSSKYAKAAMKLIEVHRTKMYPDSSYVDSWIMAKAHEIGNVCTNDTKLRKELKQNGVAAYAISRSGKFR
jgi:rRNA-processing protein FCF1